jgi:hypothetical protein
MIKYFKLLFNTVGKSSQRYFNDRIFLLMNRLSFHHSSRNKTQTTFVNISISKWKHFAWTYSNKSQQSFLYIDGVRQQSINFRVINLDFESK